MRTLGSNEADVEKELKKMNTRTVIENDPVRKGKKDALAKLKTVVGLSDEELEILNLKEKVRGN